jgi:hypothetical protein
LFAFPAYRLCSSHSRLRSLFFSSRLILSVAEASSKLAILTGMFFSCINSGIH